MHQTKIQREGNGIKLKIEDAICGLGRNKTLHSDHILVTNLQHYVTNFFCEANRHDLQKHQVGVHKIKSAEKYEK